MATLNVSKRVSIQPTELEFSSSKSSGPGGQHVNKTESRVTLRWNFSVNTSLKVAEKDRLIMLAGSKVNADGKIHISCDLHRSQKRNQDECLKRLEKLVFKAINPPKKRKPTMLPKHKKEARLKAKKKNSEKKRIRSEKF